jgi:hypothetical protein
MVEFRLADVAMLTGIRPNKLRHILAEPVFEGVDNRRRRTWRRFTARDALAAYLIRLLAMHSMNSRRARRLVREHLHPRFGRPDSSFAEMVGSLQGVLIVTADGAVNVGLAARALMARASSLSVKESSK